MRTTSKVLGAAVFATLCAAGALVVGAVPQEQAILTSALATPSEYIGLSVAAAGDTVVLGAPGVDGDRGAALVFRRTAGTWTKEALLEDLGMKSSSRLGWSVAVSGNTALLGARTANYTQGAARVFVRSGTTWTQQASFVTPDPVDDDQFGFAVALEGDTAVVSALMKDGRKGAVYVFTRSGTTWTQQAKLTASDAVDGDWFGSALALSGGTLIVGADARNSFRGAAYVFTRTGTTWTEEATLTASDPADSDNFGYAVALKGDVAVVGANNKQSQRGAAYVFRRTGTTWTQEAELSPADAVDGDGFGSAVAVAGDTVLVGAARRDNVRGAVYRFGWTGTAWEQNALMTASDAAIHDNFGYALALSGDTLVVGAYARDQERGAAYAFTGMLPPSGYVLPAAVSVKPNAKRPARSTLTVAGVLDTGSGPADFSGAATFDAGGVHLDVPAFVRKGRSLKYASGGVSLTVTPAKSGSSRAALVAKAVGDLSGKVAVSGPLTVRFKNAAHDLTGTVVVTRGRLGAHCVVAPDLCIRSARATVKGAGKDAFTVTFGFATDGVAPAAAPDLSVAFGEGYTSPLLPGTSFVRKRNTDVYSARAPGITKVKVDYTKGTIAVTGSRLALGAFDPGGNAVALTVTRGGAAVTARIRMARSGTRLSY